MSIIKKESIDSEMKITLQFSCYKVRNSVTEKIHFINEQNFSHSNFIKIKRKYRIFSKIKKLN